ncbi:MAG: TRAP transporter permease [Deltaproteobacteria bacterium]|nr:TRAP transporter permease [Deltaproteobacteria bacterium]
MDKKNPKFEEGLSPLEDEGGKKTKGFHAWFILILAVAMTLYHLYALSGLTIVTSVKLYAIHLGFSIFLIFLVYPLTSTSRKIKTRFPLYDLILGLLGACTSIYIIVFYQDFIFRIDNAPTISDLILGAITILLVLEVSRRTIGLSMPVVAVVFLVYAFVGHYLPSMIRHRGYDLERVISHLFSEQGIFNIPIGISVRYVFLFILFGSFLEACGGGKFLIDLATAMFGGTRGGPAKAETVSSAFFGTISGSAVANVIGTGTFTIPMMKSIGYKGHFAAAVECVSSTGGQIMPPVMGAGAFILAELVGISYLDVCKAAAIPAVLYFLSIYIMIDLEAAKTGLKGLAWAELPKLGPLLKKDFLFILPIFALIFFLVGLKTTATLAGFWATVVTFAITFFKKETRMGGKKLLDTLADGAIKATQVAAVCACAGIIIGIVALTGVGLKISSIMIDLGGVSILLSLFIAMCISLILGMGLPTTAAYIICAAIVAPSLIKLGLPPLGAHLFIFYFSCLSAITPPVAVAAYVAAGIARANPVKVGFTAVRLGIVAFIVPYMFVYGPALLLKGDLFSVIWATLTAIIGVSALAGAMERWFMGKGASWLQTGILFVSALLLIKPGLTTDLIGFGLLAVLFILWTLAKKRGGL